MPRRETSNERNRRRIVDAPLVGSLVRFGAPLVVGMVLHTSFNLIDLFMISRLENGTVAVAALGICDMVAAVAAILSNGVGTATVAIISRHLGRNNLSGVRRTAWQSIWLVSVLSILLGVLGVFGSDWIVRTAMQAKGEAAEIGVEYLEVQLGGCFSIFLLLQITAILRALGHAKTAASLLVGGNVLNIVLNVFLIYGPGPAPEVFAWGPPIAAAVGIERFGVIGAAWATLLARSVPVLLGFAVLLRRRSGPRFHRVYLTPFAAELKQLLRLAWPASAQLVLRVVAVLFVLSLLNGAYTTEADQTVLSAFAICLRLETMVLFVGMGWGAAASSFVGTNLGARRPQRAARAGWTAAAVNLVMMLGLGALYVVGSESILGFFDADARVIAAGQEYLRVVAWTYGLLGVGVVLSQALTGAGATLESFAVDAAVLLGLVLPAAFVVVEVLEQPRQVLWQVIAAGNVLGAIAYAGYYRRGTFLRKSV